MKLILVFIAFTFFLRSEAQYFTDTIFNKYENGLLFRMGNSFMKGQHKISFQEMGKEFSLSDIGLDLYKTAKRKLTFSKIFSFTSIASGLAAAATISKNKDLGLGFLIGQMLSLSISIQNRISGNKFLDQAIQIRNKDFLFPGKD